MKALNSKLLAWKLLPFANFASSPVPQAVLQRYGAWNATELTRTQGQLPQKLSAPTINKRETDRVMLSCQDHTWRFRDIDQPSSKQESYTNACVSGKYNTSPNWGSCTAASCFVWHLLGGRGCHEWPGTKLTLRRDTYLGGPVGVQWRNWGSTTRYCMVAGTYRDLHNTQHNGPNRDKGSLLWVLRRSK